MFFWLFLLLIFNLLHLLQVCCGILCVQGEGNITASWLWRESGALVPAELIVYIFTFVSSHHYVILVYSRMTHSCRHLWYGRNNVQNYFVRTHFAAFWAKC